MTQPRYDIRIYKDFLSYQSLTMLKYCNFYNLEMSKTLKEPGMSY